MALVPLAVVTVRSTVPAGPAGAVAVTDVAEFTVNEVAGTEPKVTAVAPVRLVPVIVTDSLPASGPDEGLRAVTVGTGGGSKSCSNVARAWGNEPSESECIPSRASSSEK